jgi:hypothetical protein
VPWLVLRGTRPSLTVGAAVGTCIIMGVTIPRYTTHSYGSRTTRGSSFIEIPMKAALDACLILGAAG